MNDWDLKAAQLEVLERIAVALEKIAAAFNFGADE